VPGTVAVAVGTMVPVVAGGTTVALSGAVVVAGTTVAVVEIVGAEVEGAAAVVAVGAGTVDSTAGASAAVTRVGVLTRIVPSASSSENVTTVSTVTSGATQVTAASPAPG